MTVSNIHDTARSAHGDQVFRDLAKALGHDVDPEAYLFDGTEAVTPFLSGFFMRPLTEFRASQLLAAAADSRVPVAQLGEGTLGCRVPGVGGVPLLALRNHDHLIYLRFSEPSGGGITVHGWGTSASAVAALPVD